MFGSVVEAMTDLMDDAGGPVTAVLRGTGVDALLSLLVVMIAMITTVFAIQSADLAAWRRGQRHHRATAGRRAVPHPLGARTAADPGRRLGASCCSSAAGAWARATASIIGDTGQTGGLALAALAYWPAVMVFVGVAVALFGWLPRLAIPLTWGVLAAMWFVVLIGDALHLPGWLLDLLPFSATPYLPLRAADLDAAGRHDARRGGCWPGPGWTVSRGATCSPADPDAAGACEPPLVRVM